MGRARALAVAVELRGAAARARRARRAALARAGRCSALVGAAPASAIARGRCSRPGALHIETRSSRRSTRRRAAASTSIKRRRADGARPAALGLRLGLVRRRATASASTCAPTQVGGGLAHDPAHRRRRAGRDRAGRLLWLLFARVRAAVRRAAAGGCGAGPPARAWRARRWPRPTARSCCTRSSTRRSWRTRSPGRCWRRRRRCGWRPRRAQPAARPHRPGEPAREPEPVRGPPPKRGGP